MARQLFVASALLLLGAFSMLRLIDVGLCGGLFRSCPGTPMWIFVEWVGGHQGLVLSAVGAYVVALVALFGTDIRQAAPESIEPKFLARALIYVGVASVMLVLATLWPTFASLLAWGS